MMPRVFRDEPRIYLVAYWCRFLAGPGVPKEVTNKRVVNENATFELEFIG
jgi:hypothetical protein